MQFRTRTLFLIVFTCCVIAFLLSSYRDYIPIRLPSYSHQTDAELYESIRDAVEDIETNHPPRTRKYWTGQLSNVQCNMTVGALFKYVPSVSNSCSLMRSDLNQTFFYAVDSKFGVACVMSKTGQRVVEPIGVFEHAMAFDEFGGIEIERVPELLELVQE